MAGQRLVDRIVRHLEHHVMETRAVVGIANVHSGPFAHRVEAFQDLDRVSAIFILIGVGCHRTDIGIGGGKSRACAYVRAWPPTYAAWHSNGLTPGEAGAVAAWPTAAKRPLPARTVGTVRGMAVGALRMALRTRTVGALRTGSVGTMAGMAFAPLRTRSVGPMRRMPFAPVRMALLTGVAIIALLPVVPAVGLGRWTMTPVQLLRGRRGLEPLDRFGRGGEVGGERRDRDPLPRGALDIAQI